MEQENLLVKQAQQGDVHAFAQLYESCYRDLYRFALYNLGQEEDARDVVSDTVLAAFEGIGKLRSTEAFRGWIFQISVIRMMFCRISFTRKPMWRCRRGYPMILKMGLGLCDCASPVPKPISGKPLIGFQRRLRNMKGKRHL